jgi:membrane-bound lytic murein transglycosylase D
LRLRIAPPKGIPSQPPKPEQIREIWVRKVSQRPVPEEAKPYVGKLKPIFSEQKVPSQLVWVAEVESSFDPSARSPVGAAGLFQLMPDTAKQYGLRTWPFDQREEPEPSARAAAAYLGHLRSKFKDWRLALAAYNSGEGTVQNLLKRHKATTYDAIASHLPAETQMFVPKVEATIQKREGVKLAELPSGT